MLPANFVLGPNARALFGLLTTSGLAAACSSGSSSPTRITIAPPPAAVTQATLVGPLCSAQACSCRDESASADGGAGVSETAGRKRFEVRLGPTQDPMWLTVGEQVLYKSAERATDCFYIDLPAGQFPVSIRASNPNGAQARASISEYGAEAQSWYKTFSYGCGGPGPCSHAEMDEQKATWGQTKAGAHDPCGSVRIKSLSWDTGTAPDGEHPSELAVQFLLDVYDKTPTLASGDAGCSLRGWK